MIVVSDTTPLNILAQLGLIDLLPQLFGAVILTPGVVKELSHPSTPDIVKAVLEGPPPWLTILAPTMLLATPLPSGLGEREAISLAAELHADLLLADDKQARKTAQALGITVIGTLGILDAAARRGLVDFADAIARLKRTNFHVSAKLLDAVLKQHEQGS
ncbi:MAG: DUF3368 domain-containing protein [Planctomycetia bacterium]|nr:DUF3368 domain-containing protein [Planctomycetia bacterium]